MASTFIRLFVHERDATSRLSRAEKMSSQTSALRCTNDMVREGAVTRS